ncbi:MAG: hypothetical protein ACI91G_001010 [Gammaproteobacteria bacterium]|jgi:hypothetical protein
MLLDLLMRFPPCRINLTGLTQLRGKKSRERFHESSADFFEVPLLTKCIAAANEECFSLLGWSKLLLCDLQLSLHRL